MIDLHDDRLKRDLNRLAEALVPNETIHPLHSATDDARLPRERTDAPEPEIIPVLSHRSRTGHQRFRLVGAAAALVLLASGVGLLLTRDREAPVGSPPRTTSTCAGCELEPGWPWTADVGMIVYVYNGSTSSEVETVRQQLLNFADIVDPAKLQYLDEQQSWNAARMLFAQDPETLALLTANNVPSMFRVIPLSGQEPGLNEIAARIRNLPGVSEVSFPPDPKSTPGEVGPDPAQINTGTAGPPSTDTPETTSTSHP
jgi:hypothetical protein